MVIITNKKDLKQYSNFNKYVVLFDSVYVKNNKAENNYFILDSNENNITLPPLKIIKSYVNIKEN